MVTERTLQDLAKAMKGIDIAMLTTTTEGGVMASRPMSNNGDVEYDGSSWFFTYDSSRTVRDIRADPRVGLGFQGKGGLLGRPGISVAVQGKATATTDRATMEAHWTKDVERYFADGLDTPGIVLLKVQATRVHYWDDGEDGEIRI